MITCPMCKKKMTSAAPPKECPSCKCDISLLVEYVHNLRDGLIQAEVFTRAGELGEAVWAYLEVLEVDPDNATARRQVGKVVTAVRQFDQTAPGPRFLKRIQKQTRFRRWQARMNEDGDLSGWFSSLGWFILIVAALILGFVLGQHSRAPADDKQGDKGANAQVR